MSKLRAHVGTIDSPNGMDISVSDALDIWFPQCVKIEIKESDYGRE